MKISISELGLKGSEELLPQVAKFTRDEEMKVREAEGWADGCSHVEPVFGFGEDCRGGSGQNLPGKVFLAR